MIGLKPFYAEQWLTEHEGMAKFNLSETSVAPLSVDELFNICDEDKGAFLDDFCKRSLDYGEIVGSRNFRELISKMYKDVPPSNIITAHGGAGANNLALCSVIKRYAKVACCVPCYQQFVSVPKWLGAGVCTVKMLERDGFLPNVEKLRRIGADVICLNNPNNPTGAVIERALLSDIVEVARESGAWIICDEVYGASDSIADVYEKGISIGSMSKVFSLAGLRLGWAATRNKDALQAMASYRDYNHISCGAFDEALASVALRNAPKIKARNQKTLDANLRILEDWVSRTDGVHWVKPKAGTTAFVQCDFWIDAGTFCKRLLDEEGVLVVPSNFFGTANGFRIGYACNPDVLKEGLERIARFVRREYK